MKLTAPVWRTKNLGGTSDQKKKFKRYLINTWKSNRPRLPQQKSQAAPLPTSGNSQRTLIRNQILNGARARIKESSGAASKSRRISGALIQLAKFSRHLLKKFSGATVQIEKIKRRPTREIQPTPVRKQTTSGTHAEIRESQPAPVSSRKSSEKQPTWQACLQHWKEEPSWTSYRSQMKLPEISSPYIASLDQTWFLPVQPWQTVFKLTKHAKNRQLLENYGKLTS